ncbi:MAG: beta-glucosidase [Hamadaea sp.]|nr:beta-glucosidase [Hamadaea sp.]
MSFPPGFVWGASTSAYQIEGAADADGRGPSIWDTFSATPGRVAGGDTGEVAAEHYWRFTEDLDHIHNLGLGAYRFSIAWPRIQPDGTGSANQKGLDFYRRLVEAMLERGITPLPTLYHWDLPQPMQDGGGWAARDTASRFAEYTAIVADSLGDLLTSWITLNEPWCQAFLGYGSGIHAPGIRDGAQALAAMHHQLLGHAHATTALRAAQPATAQVGIALNLTVAVPATDSPADADAARRLDGCTNRLALDALLRGSYPADMLEWYGAVPFVRDGDLAAIAAPLDLLGINYYSPSYVRHTETEPADALLPSLALESVSPAHLPLTDMGWPIDADAFRRLLIRLQQDYADVLPPIYITENGAAFPDSVDADGRVRDTPRVSYLRDHLRAVADAQAAGVDVRGYYAWSLLDNFEWAEGYGKRFGLIHVDYASQRRIPKESAHWLRDVAMNNALPSM